MFSTKILLAASLLTVCVPAASADPLQLDLDDGMGEWRVVVDGVMGGRSTGRVSGDLSLDNNGGFSQMRCDVSGDQFAGMRGIEITVRGDGRKYNFDVRCANARVMAGGFQRAFATRDSEWTTIRMPFDDFQLYSFGRLVPGAKSIVPTLIESIGVTLSDKTEGPFRLAVASIRTFAEETEAGEAANSDLASLSRSSTLERLIGLIESDNPKRTSRAVSSTATAQAVRLTELAISRGVPLFNDGQPAACAAIYEVTIEALIALGADGLGRSVVARLEKGLAEASTDRSYSERAWTYRSALDDAYGHLARQARGARRAAAR